MLVNELERPRSCTRRAWFVITEAALFSGLGSVGLELLTRPVVRKLPDEAVTT